MYQLSFFVPEAYAEVVKEAVFAAGAGRLGDYDRCSWQVLGQGQFRPLSGSNPHIGVQGQVEQVAEFRVEMLCADECIRKAITALQAAHPYEQPAFQYYRVNID